MSWYGRDTFKQDLLESITQLLKDHEMNPLESTEEMLDVVGHVITQFDYESEVYKKARADAFAEIHQKIGELSE